ncbi:purine-cytosine permease family protein [Paraburkholderia sediminicola]|uniref:purine-cytosine permease family protein n=1 Tax=Paraburkholderia sediminicola TaxID=458836 RepID=UPI0038BBB8BB
MERIEELRRIPIEQVMDTRSPRQRAGGSATAQDDYALRRVPSTWRWSAWSTLWAFSGMSTAMASPLTAALLAHDFGAPATILALLATLIYTCIGVWIMARKASEEGAILELMSKHTFGFRGSAFQFVILGLLGTIYFSLEAHVMAVALTEAFPSIGYKMGVAIICVGFVPLTLYGMQFLTRFQSITIWIYIAGIVAAFVGLVQGWSDTVKTALIVGHWWNVSPTHAALTWQGVLGAFGVYSGLFGSILILLSTDTARFARREEAAKAATLTSLIGATIPVLATPLLGIYLLACSAGQVVDPGIALVRVLATYGLLLVVVTQLRVNVINAYFGTNALENFSSQVLKLRWNRSAYLAPFMLVVFLITTSHFLDYFSTIMTIISVFLFNWTMVFFGEMTFVRRRFGLPQWSEFRRAYTARYNFVGLISLWLPTALGIALASGVIGPAARIWAVPVAGSMAFLLPLVITLGRNSDWVVSQYFARVPATVAALEVEQTCSICRGDYHRSDYVQCPYHQSKYICSKCCAVEKSCGEICQTQSMQTQVRRARGLA